MTYPELLNRFWREHSLEHFTNAEIALYGFLVAENNVRRWPERFLLTTDEIVSRLGLHRNSILSARKKLSDRKLITVSATKGSGVNYYSICDADVRNADKKGGKNDSINMLDIQTELAQSLCSAWGEKGEKAATEVSFKVAQLLCRFEKQVAQQVAQRLAQLMCNYTLYNDNTNVLSEEKRKKNTPLTPQGGEREKFDEFLAWYFADERRGSIDPLCKNFGVSYAEYRRLAEEAIDEMCAAGVTVTDNQAIAQKMQNFVRCKARAETNSQNAAKPKHNPYGIPIGPGEWFDANGCRRYDDSPTIVPIAAIPRPSPNYRWDAQANRWVL